MHDCTDDICAWLGGVNLEMKKEPAQSAARLTCRRSGPSRGTNVRWRQDDFFYFCISTQRKSSRVPENARGGEPGLDQIKDETYLETQLERT